MGLKYFNTRLRDVAFNRNLHLDYRLLEFAKKSNIFKSFQTLRRTLLSINNGKDISTENYVTYNTSNIIYPTVNNFKNGIVDLSSVTFVNDVYLDESLRTLKTDDIIISRSGTVGLTFVWNEENINKLFQRKITAIPSGYLIVITVNKETLLPKFIEYYFATDLMKQYFNVFGVGKSQKNIAQPEILSIPVPQISLSDQQKILEKASPIEKEIEKLKAHIKPDSEIINEVFTSIFKWDIKMFNELKTLNIINMPFNSFANNIDVRFSYKFHNKAGEYVTKILRSQTSKRIKDFLSEEITLGKSISPADYDENGMHYYLSMADIKSWAFNTEEAKTVSQPYFEENQNKQIILNDIIIARSGEGTIGKVALINNEENEAVYADFTMRIRLKNYVPPFAYYYFRTDFFQYLIYTHKKGLGNNTNIFPSQLREFPVPDKKETEQLEIVSHIQTAINQQRNIEQEIKKKKQAISELIEGAIIAS